MTHLPSSGQHKLLEHFRSHRPRSLFRGLLLACAVSLVIAVEVFAAAVTEVNFRGVRTKTITCGRTGSVQVDVLVEFRAGDPRSVSYTVSLWEHDYGGDDRLAEREFNVDRPRPPFPKIERKTVVLRLTCADDCDTLSGNEGADSDDSEDYEVYAQVDGEDVETDRNMDVICAELE